MWRACVPEPTIWKWRAIRGHSTKRVQGAKDSARKRCRAEDTLAQCYVAKIDKHPPDLTRIFAPAYAEKNWRAELTCAKMYVTAETVGNSWKFW